MTQSCPGARKHALMPAGPSLPFPRGSGRFPWLRPLPARSEPHPACGPAPQPAPGPAPIPAPQPAPQPAPGQHPAQHLAQHPLPQTWTSLSAQRVPVPRSQAPRSPSPFHYLQLFCWGSLRELHVPAQGQGCAAGGRLRAESWGHLFGLPTSTCQDFHHHLCGIWAVSAFYPPPSLLCPLQVSA